MNIGIRTLVAGGLSAVPLFLLLVLVVAVARNHVALDVIRHSTTALPPDAAANPTLGSNSITVPLEMASVAEWSDNLFATDIAAVVDIALAITAGVGPTPLTKDPLARLFQRLAFSGSLSAMASDGRRVGKVGVRTATVEVDIDQSAGSSADAQVECRWPPSSIVTRYTLNTNTGVATAVSQYTLGTASRLLDWNRAVAATTVTATMSQAVSVQGDASVFIEVLHSLDNLVTMLREVLHTSPGYRNSGRETIGVQCTNAAVAITSQGVCRIGEPAVQSHNVLCAHLQGTVAVPAGSFVQTRPASAAPCMIGWASSPTPVTDVEGYSADTENVVILSILTLLASVIVLLSAVVVSASLASRQVVVFDTVSAVLGDSLAPDHIREHGVDASVDRINGVIADVPREGQTTLLQVQAFVKKVKDYLSFSRTVGMMSPTSNNLAVSGQSQHNGEEFMGPSDGGAFSMFPTQESAHPADTSNGGTPAEVPSALPSFKAFQAFSMEPPSDGGDGANGPLPNQAAMSKARLNSLESADGVPMFAVETPGGTALTPQSPESLAADNSNSHMKKKAMPSPFQTSLTGPPPGPPGSNWSPAQPSLGGGGIVSQEYLLQVESLQTAVDRLGVTGYSRKRATFLLVRMFNFTHDKEIDDESLSGLSRAFLENVINCGKLFDGVVARMSADSIVLSWNAFTPYSFSEVRACLCAIHIAAAFSNPDSEDDFTTLKWNISVSCGVVACGVCGNGSISSPTVAGDCIPFMYQVSDLGFLLGCPLVISEGVNSVARDQIWSAPLDIVGSKAEKQVAIYELRGKHSDGYDMTHYQTGFSKMCSNQFDEAVESFQAHLTERKEKGNDTREGQAIRLGQLCEYFDLPTSIAPPVPYYRQYPAWTYYELEVSNSDLPPDVLLAMRDAKMIDDVPIVNNEAEERQELLDEIHGDTSRQFSDMMDISPASTMRPGGPEESPMTPVTPNAQVGFTGPEADEATTFQFQDRHKQMWRRSGKVLGKGSFGEVYVGMAQDGALVAMKVLSLQKLIGQDQGPITPMKSRAVPKEIEEILSEVQLLVTLRHENIVGYLSSAVYRGNLIIIMEYVSGGSLATMISRFGLIALSSARRYARDTLQGLRYLHEKGIVHRDIGPNNVLLMIDGVCKLSDFGASGNIQALAEGGTIVGTPAYMAPEAARGQAESASDIWSFGVMLVVMLTGRMCFPVEMLEDVVALMRRLANDESFGPTIPPDLPETAKGIVAMCLQRDPKKRPTAEKLLVHPFIV